MHVRLCLWGNIACSLFPVVPPFFRAAAQTRVVLQWKFAVSLRAPRAAEEQVSGWGRGFLRRANLLLGEDTEVGPR